MSTLESINFTRGVPANESFPLDEMRDAAAAVLKDHGTAVLQYGPAAGFGPLREWIAGWQGVDADLRCSWGTDLWSSSNSSAVTWCGLATRSSPSPRPTIAAFSSSVATVRKSTGIPLENDGPDIDALEAALKKRVPKFFYVIADFQNPSGATCSRAQATADRGTRAAV